MTLVIQIWSKLFAGAKLPNDSVTSHTNTAITPQSYIPCIGLLVVPAASMSDRCIVDEW
jgi:hypothetical protein